MKKILLGLSLVISANLFAQQDEIYVKENAAINGYDVVAYFKEGKPVKGVAEFSVSYKGANWLFANNENAELFKSNPGKYEPQYVVIVLLVVQEVIKQKQVLMHGR